MLDISKPANFSRAAVLPEVAVEKLLQPGLCNSVATCHISRRKLSLISWLVVDVQISHGIYHCFLITLGLIRIHVAVPYMYMYGNQMHVMTVLADTTASLFETVNGFQWSYITFVGRMTAFKTGDKSWWNRTVPSLLGKGVAFVEPHQSKYIMYVLCDEKYVIHISSMHKYIISHFLCS